MIQREHRKILDEFETELIAVINSHSIDNILHTPDFILARHVVKNLENLLNLFNDVDNWNDADGTPDHYDDLDGDAATALASAGWGTDEDYGGDLSDGTHF
jgi:hypothetical protein